MTTIEVNLPVPSFLVGWRELSVEARWQRAAKVALGAATIAGVLYVACFLLLALVVSINNGVGFTGYAADGPFQLYDPLRRLAAGQVLGRDFQFFNGVAIPLLYFPMFKLMGSHVFASEFSRWFISVGLFIASTAVLFFAAFKNWQKSLLATSACVLVFTVVDFSVVWPSNSLIGTRTIMPIVFAGLYLLDYGYFRLPRIGWQLPTRELVLGFCAAVAVALGTEQGIALVLAYVLWEGCRGVRDGRKTFARLGWFIGSFVVTVAAIFTLVSEGHPLPPLIYAFVDVPKDQGWFFGAPPNPFLTWHNFIGQVTMPFLLEVYGFTALLIAGLIVLRKHRVTSSRVTGVGVILIIYGAIALVGPAVGGYFAAGEAVALNRVVVTMLILLASYVVFARWDGRLNWRHVHLPRLTLPVLRVFLLACFCVFAVQSGINQFRLARTYHIHLSLHLARVARHADDYFDAAPGWQGALRSFEPIIGHSKSVWSTYESLYEAQAGIIGPSTAGADYIIHALGPARRNQYQHQFAVSRPAFVITLRPSYFPYEAWLWNNEWPFYRQLLINYHIVQVDGSHYLWARNTGAPAQSGQWSKVPVSAGGNLFLPGQTKGMAVDEVTVHYLAHGIIPLTSSYPRYLLTVPHDSINLPVSLPPYEKTWQFPVVLLDGSKPTIVKSSVAGLFPGNLTIQSAQYRQIQVTPSEMQMFMDSYCYHWNWPAGGGHWLTIPACQVNESEK